MGSDEHPQRVQQWAASLHPHPSARSPPLVRQLGAPMVALLEPDLTAPDRRWGAQVVLEKIILFAFGNIT